MLNWVESAQVAAVVAVLLNIVYAAAILVIALFVAGWVKARIEHLPNRYPRVDATLFSFLGNVAKYAVMVFAIIFVLNRFGIQTASIIAVIGAAGLAIGLALQGTLSNLAAGVMLVLFRPFRVGDFIDASGNMGTVRDITLFYIEMTTYDGLKKVVPNSDIWSSAIVNYSANPTRMIDLTIGVAYGSDLKKTEAVLHEVLEAETRGLPDPAPFVKVKELGDSSVDFVVRLWVNRPDWWVTKCELTAAIKMALDENGITIPFPTRTLDLPEGWQGPAEALPKPRVVPAE